MPAPHHLPPLPRPLRRMLRPLSLAAVIAVVAVLASSVPGAIAAATSPPTSRFEVIDPGKTTVVSKGVAPYRMLFVGASITAGVGAATVQDSYPNVMAAQVAESIHRPVALAVVSRPGAVAGMARSWKVPADQRMIVVHLSTNDFLRSVPLRTYEANEIQVLKRLRASSPHATMFCMGTWAGPGDTDRKGSTAAAYDTEAAASCRAVNGTYVALGPLFQQAALHGDSPRPSLAGAHLAFHPNSRGHAQIAAAIMRQLNADRTLPIEHKAPPTALPA